MSKKTKVLVVDDDIYFTEGLTDILTEKGYIAVAVNGGENALEKIKETSFDVILMDIRMPVMDGVETFKKIKKRSRSTAVIMMTAHSMDDLVRDALKEGAYGVLPKPLDIEQLMRRIEIAKAGGSLTMIVINDANIRKSLKDILEEKGYVVTMAQGGRKAIDILKERPQDIVFIDMRLHFLNGLETFLELKKINPKIHAIIITAHKEEMQDLIEQALASGAYACIYKPFDPQNIIGMVEEITRIKRKLDLRRKKILLADDEKSILTSLTDIFEDRGFEVIQAANGLEAVEKARRENPNVVLLDTLMPGIGGIEACRQIKQVENLSCKVIVYTGNIDAIDAVQARRYGTDDYCVKGNDPRLLIETTEKYL
jgi:two-component system response regulator HydG